MGKSGELQSWGKCSKCSICYKSREGRRSSSATEAPIMPDELTPKHSQIHLPLFNPSIPLISVPNLWTSAVHAAAKILLCIAVLNPPSSLLNKFTINLRPVN
jgi:hypothetical protein